MSQAKHWCEYCRIYIAGNKSSIAFHENGKKHKEIVELALRDMRKRGREKRNEDSEVQKELKKIEREALKDYMHHDLAKEPRAPPAGSALPANHGARLAEIEQRITANRMERAFNAAAGGSALPPGWRAMTNPDGKVFYMHDASGAIQWDRPSSSSGGGGGAAGAGGGAAGASGQSSSSSNGTAVAASGGAAGAAAPSAAGWQQGWNEQGVPYYYDAERGLTQWEPPADWAAEASARGGGSVPAEAAAPTDGVADGATLPESVAPEGSEPSQSQHELMLAQLDKQEEQAQQQYEAMKAAAAAADDGVDASTGLGTWTTVDEAKPEEGWDYAQQEKRQRVAWAVNKEEERAEEEEALLGDLKARLPMSEDMQRAVEQQQAAAAAAAEAALADAPAAGVAKRKGGNKGGIRKK